MLRPKPHICKDREGQYLCISWGCGLPWYVAGHGATAEEAWGLWAATLLMRMLAVPVTSGGGWRPIVR